MSSILTNNGAMVALQSLQSINKNLAKTQNLISTGKAVASAKDNAAVWAISKVMESDVAGFKAIKDSLGLGQSTVAVASNATETVEKLLKEMKGKIVSAQDSNVDRGKIQTDITALRDEITSVVAAAQFNGLSMLSNKAGAGDGTAALTATQVRTAQKGGEVEVLGSLDRSTSGVAASYITAGKQDLGTSAAVWRAGNTSDVNATGAVTGGGATIAAGATQTLTFVGNAGAAATSARVGIAVLAGDGYRINATAFGSTGNIDYVARDGDTLNDIAAGMAAKINDKLARDGITGFTVAANGAQMTITNNTAAATTVGTTVTAGAGGTAGGGLELLGTMDVSTENGAKAALASIEGLIQTSIDAGAAFGSTEKRIDIQADFIGKLMDSMKSGIGTLVDANMEEASARLQALQVQQQLGVQSLSIANQAPQSILSLFR